MNKTAITLGELGRLWGKYTLLTPNRYGFHGTLPHALAVGGLGALGGLALSPLVSRVVPEQAKARVPWILAGLGGMGAGTFSSLPEIMSVFREPIEKAEDAYYNLKDQQTSAPAAPAPMKKKRAFVSTWEQDVLSAPMFEADMRQALREKRITPTEAAVSLSLMRAAADPKEQVSPRSLASTVASTLLTAGSGGLQGYVVGRAAGMLAGGLGLLNRSQQDTLANTAAFGGILANLAISGMK